jgi:aconitate hydratase
MDGRVTYELPHGSVVIAAITSCTNTSNPEVMLGAGLVAKKAVERGLDTKPWVKTSLAPGSKVVTEYLEGAGLMPYLEALGFHLVGYGCTTCIGNSGRSRSPVADASDGRPCRRVGALGQPQLRGARQPAGEGELPRLAAPRRGLRARGDDGSGPPTEPLGHDRNGQPVFLADIWPTPEEMADAIARRSAEPVPPSVRGRLRGDEGWRALPVPTGDLRVGPVLDLREEAAVLRRPRPEPKPLGRRRGARVLAGPRRLHHHRPHLPRRQHRQEARPPYLGARREAEPTSTPTAPAAATTR